MSTPDTSQVDAELREDDNLLREVIMEIGRKFNPRLKDHEIRSIANMNHLVTFTRKRLLKTSVLKRLFSQPHQDSLERVKLAARLSERMQTLVMDGKMVFVDGANNRTLTDHERIEELREALNKEEQP